jgi:hypothetical protein
MINTGLFSWLYSVGVLSWHNFSYNTFSIAIFYILDIIYFEILLVNFHNMVTSYIQYVEFI